ncbi:MAG: hypothetical protein L0Y80_00150 [Ignavibacteriae bacterium]|nr:hypothetical protein [Ignavibacteriota bacterium]
MPKVILQISYDIRPEKHDEYLKLVEEMKAHFVSEKKKDYSVYEQRGKKFSYVEQFVCQSMEEFDALEDDQDERGEELVNRLEGLLQEGKSRYVTLAEVG